MTPVVSSRIREPGAHKYNSPEPPGVVELFGDSADAIRMPKVSQITNLARLPDPSLAPPFPSLVRANTPLRLVDLYKRYKVNDSASPGSNMGPGKEVELQDASTTVTVKEVVKEELENIPSVRGGTMKAPVNETDSHLMARSKDDPKPTGPDQFLSLLDLVRKK